MKERTVGVVGAGTIVRDVHLPVLANVAGVRVAWITDALIARARDVGLAYGVPPIELPEEPHRLPPCDVALLAVPVGARQAYHEVFATRGTAVLAEKPFALGAAAHERLVGLAPEAQLACGYMRRFYRPAVVLRDAIQSGLFGPLRHVRIAEGGRATGSGLDRTFRDRSSAEGGGVTWEMGCHLLDQVVFVTAARSFELLEREVVLDAGTDRHARARFRLEGVPSAGGDCELELVVSWLDPQPNEMVLEFEHATLRGGLRPGSEVRVGSREERGPAFELGGDAPAARTSFQAFYLEWRDFLDGAAEGRASRIAATTSLLTTRMIEALLAAHGRG